MYRKMWLLSLTFVVALLLVGGVLALTRKTPVSAAPLDPQAPADLPITDYITVTSTSDDGGDSQRCDTASPCTLRRAINQVRWYSSPSKVFRIGFDIDTNDSGYDGVNGVWIIDVDSDNTFETFAFRAFGTHGRVIVDGTTQPIGRDLGDGPRIILRGDNDKGAFNLAGGSNVVRGLAFQAFGDNTVYVPATNDNRIEDNWFGLAVDGQDIYLRNAAHPEDGSGEGGIFVQMSGSNGTHNTIQGNVLAGFKAGAVNVQGSYNSILSNTVGTRADGTVPDVPLAHKCHPNAYTNNWFPGAGIDIFGTGNLVAYNRVVGMLFRSADPLNTPDDALSVTGHDHVVRNNIIGVTGDGVPFGTCGEGIHVGGVSGGHFIQVVTNTVVGAQGAAGIFVTGAETGYDLDAVTVQGNVILDSKVEAFDFGKKVPAALREFNPAAITAIDGLAVTGTSGADSLCENCVIEVFLDADDTVTETLQSLGKTTADGSGNWSFALTRTLALTEGLRTASTTTAYGQIQNAGGSIIYNAGTTTRISELYTPGSLGGSKIYLPLVLRNY